MKVEKWSDLKVSTYPGDETWVLSKDGTPLLVKRFGGWMKISSPEEVEAPTNAEEGHLTAEIQLAVLLYLGPWELRVKTKNQHRTCVSLHGDGDPSPEMMEQWMKIHMQTEVIFHSRRTITGPEKKSTITFSNVLDVHKMCHRMDQTYGHSLASVSPEEIEEKFLPQLRLILAICQTQQRRLRSARYLHGRVLSKGSHHGFVESTLRRIVEPHEVSVGCILPQYHTVPIADEWQPGDVAVVKDQEAHGWILINEVGTAIPLRGGGMEFADPACAVVWDYSEKPAVWKGSMESFLKAQEDGSLWEALR